MQPGSRKEQSTGQGQDHQCRGQLPCRLWHRRGPDGQSAQPVPVL